MKKKKKNPKIKVSKRKFYRTVYTVEVLSEDPPSEGVELDTIASQIVDGGWSGKVTRQVPVEVDALTMAGLLQNQGSDPSFFWLTEHGEDCDECDEE